MSPFATLRETEEAVGERVGALPIDFNAMHALSSLHRAANAIRTHTTNTVLRDADISWTGFVVLWSVWIYDGLPTSQAAESANISKATLTGVVGTLENRGWIERSTDPDDRRLINLALTDDGRALMDSLFPKFNALEADIVAPLGDRKVRELTKSLRLIVEQIEQLELD
ncbi:MarR family transcriptional regulator [Gordonia sp. TBRC 11910]|uniref:MarR family transcriptional regulator n=1 Tax=Gordonia asplenii TaxID=2725283 RepID=A0A848LAH5_9ACTN|nr:MarR family transcriptional regulator [Gordonia asplenii]NMO04568.1 MarR family transcriptional regulator [Gordonia asplenii]